MTWYVRLWLNEWTIFPNEDPRELLVKACCLGGQTGETNSKVALGFYYKAVIDYRPWQRTVGVYRDPVFLENPRP